MCVCVIDTFSKQNINTLIIFKMLQWTSLIALSISAARMEQVQIRAAGDSRSTRRGLVAGPVGPAFSRSAPWHTYRNPTPHHAAPRRTRLRRAMRYAAAIHLLAPTRSLLLEARFPPPSPGFPLCLSSLSLPRLFPDILVYKARGDRRYFVNNSGVLHSVSGLL